MKFPGQVCVEDNRRIQSHLGLLWRPIGEEIGKSFELNHMIVIHFSVKWSMVASVRYQVSLKMRSISQIDKINHMAELVRIIILLCLLNQVTTNWLGVEWKGKVGQEARHFCDLTNYHI